MPKERATGFGTSKGSDFKLQTGLNYSSSSLIILVHLEQGLRSLPCFELAS